CICSALYFIYLHCYDHPLELHSFPTRRSSDLFAVISTTISLAAVFLPILFLDGLTGRLFKEFGVVVAGSILVSAFVALSLSPMIDRKSTRLNSSHVKSSYAVFCLKKKKIDK